MPTASATATLDVFGEQPPVRKQHMDPAQLDAREAWNEGAEAVLREAAELIEGKPAQSRP